MYSRQKMTFITMRKAAIVVALLLLCCATSAQAQVVNPFDVRYSANERGDVEMVGNVLITCATSVNNCGTLQGGTGNNGPATRYVDTDTDATTTNSSSATLSLPAGSTVLFAGLYWGGRANPSANPDNRRNILFRRPGGSYQTVVASQLDTITSAGATTTRPYLAFADVTSIVQQGGSGQYFAANITASTNTANDGLGFYAGWSLVVVYRDTSQAFRRLMVFDGAASVSTGNPQTILVTGLLTPATGSFTTRMGAVVWEGDQGITGDNFTLNGTALTDGQNPAGNFWNSTISRLGTRFSAKNPDYVNQLGLDVDYVNASGILANGATTATLGFGTTGDTYFPHALVFVVDLFVPDLASSITKSVSDVNGGTTQVGDILEYTVNFTNTGQDGATKVVVSDPIPAGTTYVPGSIVIVSNAPGSPTGAMTDASGDDLAEYDAGNNRVVARIGTGATASEGGLLAVNQSGSFRFRVQVTDVSKCSQTITNTATVTNASQTLGDSYTQSASASASSNIAACADVSISKTDNVTQVSSGSTTTYTISVTNNGPNAANGAAVKDPAVAGLQCTAVTCTGATNGAVCPSTVDIGTLQGPSGLTIPTFPANSTVTFQLTCDVTATGQE